MTSSNEYSEVELPLLRLLANRRRNPVRRVNHPGAFRNLVDVVDKDRALIRQLIHYKAVVDDFLADVDGRAKGFERNPDDVDCPHYACTETARFQQQNAFFLRSGRPWLGSYRCCRRDGAHVLYYTVNKHALPQ